MEDKKAKRDYFPEMRRMVKELEDVILDRDKEGEVEIINGLCKLLEIIRRAEYYEEIKQENREDVDGL